MVISFTTIFSILILLFLATLSFAYDPDYPDDNDASFPTSIFFIFGLLFFLVFLIALIRIIRQWKYGEAMAGFYANSTPVIITNSSTSGGRRGILRGQQGGRMVSSLAVPNITVVEVDRRPEGAPPTYEESVTVTTSGDGFNYSSF